MCSSLDDRKKYSSDIIIHCLMMFVLSASSVMCFLHVSSIGGFICSSRGANIEYHHNIGAQCALNINTSLWAEKMLRSIMRRAKVDAIIGYIDADIVSIGVV